ncbi:chymotrypsin-1 [Mycetomoellerius zeteki]|uniref:chymotrypsin-1 n=1 Tax=Mycetomoellerius zeteki TaxID=64791 RepID=UPI00084EC54C|nr:PREDICTED: chymotrypsin-1-like [Trachymyrmex zeteki]
MLSFICLVVGVLAQQTFAEEPEAIVGGQIVNPGEFPHQVSLRYNGNHVCGGSIIGPEKILTAAHCVTFAKPPYKDFKVATGSVLIYGGEYHDIEKIIVHPQYSDKYEDAWKNDIAVIKLASPIQYNQFQKPISLAKSKPFSGQMCTLSGWGRISTNGPLPSILQKMVQIVVSQSQCQKDHPDVPLTATHLCTLNRSGIGACQGDSGGPLISNGVQIGITSWVAPCAQGYSDVYTDVWYPIIVDIFSEKEAECEIQDAPSANHSRKELDEFDLIYGRKLCSPILGYNCQLPDLPTSSIPSTTLDTSLLHIPIYAHLKIYSLEPVRLPEPPSILSSLQLQFSEGTILSKSSREISLTARLSEENGIFASCSARNSKKLRMLNKE